MGVKIFCQDKEILDVKNYIFSIIYNNMMNYLEKANLNVSSDIENLLFQLYTATHGIGLDIADYLKKKQDVIFFADLLRLAIDQEQKSSEPFNEEAEEVLRQFYQSIVDYGNRLSQ